VAVVWRYLYHPRFGLINHVLGWFGIPPLDWLADTTWALPAIILLSIWKNFGYAMVLFLAGLQSIPPQLYEAARIDGAGIWREFRHVTLPLLAPTFLFVGIITSIGYLQIFAEPYVMTRGGGPVNSTLTVVLFMYKEGFRWWNMGFAAAVALVLFLVILAATLLQIRLQRRGLE
jgi:multiple sugar transport system permease protein